MSKELHVINCMAASGWLSSLHVRLSCIRLRVRAPAVSYQRPL